MEYARELPCDVAAQLYHAILVRNGATAYMRNPLKNETMSLEAKIEAIRARVDTTEDLY